MNNNILNEEILRIKEVMGVKENLITEAIINPKIVEIGFINLEVIKSTLVILNITIF